jgi:hypothetical protein
MNIPFRLPPFGRFVDMLNAAGVHTASARGFWGGVNDAGEIIVTSWIDGHDGEGRFYVWRPRTNHGGLKAQWEIGNIRVGTEVRLILLRQRGDVPLLAEGRSIGSAVLLSGKWRVVEMPSNKPWQAVIEPSSVT